jgi:alkaline phosphatase
MAVLDDQKQSWNAFNFEVFNPLKEAQTWNSTEDNIPDELWEALGRVFGLHPDGLSQSERAALEDAYDVSMATRGQLDERGRRPAHPLYSRYEPLPLTAAVVVGLRAGVHWATYSHSPMPVPVWALGPTAYRFNGFYDNTDIARKLAEAMRVEIPPPFPASQMQRHDPAEPQPDYTNRADLTPALVPAN